MSYPSFRRQRGIAIIVAVVMAALVAGLAFIMAGRERLWLYQQENRKDFAAAQSITLGAINLARLTIRDDGRNNQVDHQSEPWNTPIPSINVEDGKVAGQLSELQGRFNLGTLRQNNKVDSVAVEAFGRLLATQGLSQKLADSLAEYLKQRLPKGATDDSGLLVQPVDWGELAAVPGFTPEVIGRLEPLVSFLPASTPVNVNFVSPEVLSALTPGLSTSEAQTILSKRAAQHFISVSAFLDAVPERWRKTLSAYRWTVQSDYFLLTSESWFGRVYLRYQTLLRREGRNIATVVWMKRVQDSR